MQLNLFDDNEHARAEPDTLKVATVKDIELTEAERNHYGLTEDEVLELEAMAEFRNNLADRRMARLPDNCKGSYESELMKQPTGYVVVRDEGE